MFPCSHVYARLTELLPGKMITPKKICFTGWNIGFYLIIKKTSRLLCGVVRSSFSAKDLKLVLNNGNLGSVFPSDTADHQIRSKKKTWISMSLETAICSLLFFGSRRFLVEKFPTQLKFCFMFRTLSNICFCEKCHPMIFSRSCWSLTQILGIAFFKLEEEWKIELPSFCQTIAGTVIAISNDLEKYQFCRW